VLKEAAKFARMGGMRKSLLALAVAAFGIGTSEFIIMGLLPNLAKSFSVSIPKEGVLVSAYALSVTFGSPLVALLLARTERRRALLILMGIFVTGNLLCALAPNYELLLCARVLTALCHGAFFGIGSIVATNLVPFNQRTQAVTLMFSGLTIANVLGVPAGTALGQAFGWRAAFLALIPVGLIALAALYRMVPEQASEAVELKHELRAVVRPQVQLVLSLSTISSTALFCVFTYIAPILEVVTHLSPHAVTWVLVLFGVSITLGNLLGGWLGDWKPMPLVVSGLVILIGIFLVMPVAMQHVWPALVVVFVWGLVHFGAIAPLQARIVEQAKGAPNLASTLNQGAFNLGNALGASLGGLVLTAGYGYLKLPVAGAVVLVVCLGIAVVTVVVERRDGRVGADFVNG
jgi:DHA1 family inner membrane transport protein